MAQMVENLPAVQKTQVQSLGPEDALEKGMATHSSIFAHRIPWKEKRDELQSMGWQRVGHDWGTNTYTVKKRGLQINHKMKFGLHLTNVTSSLAKFLSELSCF